MLLQYINDKITCLRFLGEEKIYKTLLKLGFQFLVWQLVYDTSVSGGPGSPLPKLLDPTLAYSPAQRAKLVQAVI